MAHLWRRGALAAGLGLTLVVGWGTSADADRVLTVQEALLRAKPAVALVIAEVVAEVSLNCGSGETRVTPPPFRETGTGWFIDARGLLITNGHVVQPAHTPPRWMINSFARRAIESAETWSSATSRPARSTSPSGAARAARRDLPSR